MIVSLASLSDSKREVTYYEAPARSLLNRVRDGLPFRWTLNPYRGCEFGCKYCYARYTHGFFDLAPEEFEDRIYAKSGVGALVRRD
ncbi:MAG: radical SAM protein, partial [Bryobacteraceae bacterium]